MQHTKFLTAEVRWLKTDKVWYEAFDDAPQNNKVYKKDEGEW